MADSPKQHLERLRRSLLAEEQTRLSNLEETLDALRKQVNEKEWLVASVSPVLTDVIDRNTDESVDALAESLSPAIGPAMTRQIGRAKDDIVDALYPIIGKTVRKAVAEAIKKLADNINRKIESALRRNRVRKEISARISGISPGELILKESLPFSIQEIFLIHRDTGLLISHASSTDEKGMNRELVSGMLSAIQSFADEAFSQGGRQDVNEIQYGDQRIIIEPSHTFYAAYVIRGVAPDAFPGQTRRLMERIRHLCGPALRDFDGDGTPFQKVNGLMQDMIAAHRDQSEPQPAPASSEKRAGLLFGGRILGLIALILLSIFLFFPMIQAHLIFRTIQDFLVSDPAYQQVHSVQKGFDVQVSGYVEEQDAFARLESRLTSLGFKRLIRDITVDQPGRTIRERVAEKLNPLVQDGRLSYLLFLRESHAVLKGNTLNGALKVHVGDLVRQVDGIASLENDLIPLNLSPPQVEVLHYDSGTFQLLPVHRSRLDNLAGRMREKTEMTALIRGYSDGVGSEGVNLNLSRNRAATVRDYLHARGIAHGRLLLQYFGATQKQGRRVEIEVRFDDAQ